MWEQVNARLVRQVRQQHGREHQPSAGVPDGTGGLLTLSSTSAGIVLLFSARTDGMIYLSREHER